MLKRAVLAVLCLAVALSLALVVGCTGSDSEETTDSSPPAESSDEAQDSAEEDAAAEGDAAEGGTTVLVGRWENPEGGVFRVITYREDGTADTVNYAGTEDVATWTIEDGYLKVETAGGESYGSPIEWVSDAEFTWAYESGSWVQSD